MEENKSLTHMIKLWKLTGCMYMYISLKIKV